MVHLLALLGLAQAQPLVAIVVVDQEARESGYALEIDGWLVEDALPVDVVAGERVVLVDAVGRAELLDLEPGEAWEVTGADGEAWMSKLDEEVRTDLIVVRGSQASIEALAASLDAEVVTERGRTYLTGEGVLLKAPWVDDKAALEVQEVGLVRVEADPQVTVRDPAPRVPTAGARPVAVVLRAVAAPDPVAPVAPVPVVAEADETAGAPASGEADEVEAPLAAVVPVRLADSDDNRAQYAGLHLCRDDVLWLHASGTYAFRGVDGIWTASTPGVVRLLTDDGQVLFRAAIDPDSGHCRDVWSPEETADPMPRGYGRLSKRGLGPAQ